MPVPAQLPASVKEVEKASAFCQLDGTTEDSKSRHDLFLIVVVIAILLLIRDNIMVMSCVMFCWWLVVVVSESVLVLYGRRPGDTKQQNHSHRLLLF